MTLRLLFLIFISSTCFAQSGFYTRFTNFTNTPWEHQPSENLGTILLDAYLRGQLKAYKFDVAHDILKYGPLPKEQKPDDWNRDYDYYLDDMVFHKGAVYVARTDIARPSAPPDSSNYWDKTGISGPIVSLHHHFPTEKDSTTKSFLLSNLIEYVPDGYEQWQEGYEYFTDDRIEYKGKAYVAQGNNFADIVPGTNENYWVEVPSRIQYFSINDLRIISVLYHYEIHGSDTIHTPQMVSVRVMDSYTELFRNTGLNFFYADVAKHLSAIPQPVLYLSDIGHAEAGTFLFDDRTKPSFSRWLQSKIASKEIKLDKKAILNDAEYNLFINAKAEDITGTSWYPIQNPATKDIIIISGKVNTDYNYYTIPTLLIKYKSIEKLLKTMSTGRYRTYGDVFTDPFMVSSVDSVYMDSIDALPSVAAPPPVNFNEMYFDEIQFDKLDENPLLQKHIPKLWELVAANKPKFQPTQSYFPCRFNFKGTEVTWSLGKKILDEGFSISTVEAPPAELPPAHWKLKEAGVVYRITRAGKFSPHQLVISFEEEAHAELVNYRVNWEDVVRIAAGKHEFSEFITAVQKATVNFKQSATVYNYVVK